MNSTPKNKPDLNNRLQRIFTTLETKGYNLNSTWILEHHGTNLLAEIEEQAQTLNDDELSTWIQNKLHEIAAMQRNEFNENKINGQKIQWYQLLTKRKIRQALNSMQNLPNTNNDIERPLAA